MHTVRFSHVQMNYVHADECRESTHFKLAANYLITASSPDHCTIFIHMCLHLLGIRKYMNDITCGKYDIMQLLSNDVEV